MGPALVAIVLIAWPVSAAADDAAHDPPLLLHENFSKGADRWEPTDAKVWKVVETDKGNIYSQFRQSDYTPPHRSPFNFALIKELNLEDVVLEGRVQSTVKDYAHRDVCVIFGYQDAAHFYYVHFGKKADEYSNQVFIVNGAPRKKISTKTSEGTNWDDDWHQLKIMRQVRDGKIEVFFDDMKKPVMTAKDKTFTWGRVGVGSFDDTANWSDVRVHGTKAENK